MFFTLTPLERAGRADRVHPIELSALTPEEFTFERGPPVCLHKLVTR